MRTALVGVLLTLVAAAGCASSQGESQAVMGYDFSKIDKVAIIEVTGRVYGETVKNQISDYFTFELMKRGYQVIERKDIKPLLKEQEFQASDLTTDEGAAKAGKFLNVPAALVINVPKYDERLEMTAKLIDVENGTILWIGRGSSTTGKTLSTIVGVAAGAALGAAVGGHDMGDRVIGGVIGGAAGGVVGNALSPQQEEQVKKVLAKVVESLPPRFPPITPQK
jgi:TolB-like protein